MTGATCGNKTAADAAQADVKAWRDARGIAYESLWINNTLSLMTQMKQDTPQQTLIRNTDYGAQAIQMPAPTMGTHIVETLIESPLYKLYRPLLMRAATSTFHSLKPTVTTFQPQAGGANRTT